MLQIIPASLEHIDEITSIFAHHVLHGNGSFHITPLDKEAMAQKWGLLHERQHPFLVGWDHERQRVVGFCYASDFRPKEAFQWTLEDSIYVHPEHQRQGVGKALLHALIEDCQRLGFKQLVAVIGDAQNQGSIGLHTALGFEHRGTLKKVGHKHDSWLDLVLMQLQL
jgi:phosphinothricin acetyltransferase